jgi:transposase
MRFLEAYGGWDEGKLSQEEAARILGVCERTFRRYINRYEEEGADGLLDRRLSQASHRRAPVDEVLALSEQYQSRYHGWGVKHFYSWYKREGGRRSYSWVKNQLQSASLVKKALGRGKHRKRRQRMPLPGMMIHQDGSTHAWVPKESGGEVDKRQLTQFGRAMKQLGIGMIAAYSPQARGRSERVFGTHQGRLPKELAAVGITDMTEWITVPPLICPRPIFR